MLASPFSVAENPNPIKQIRYCFFPGSMAPMTGPLFLHTGVDVRVMAATNRNPEETVAAGGFRRDFCKRINQMTTAGPPLRERWEHRRPGTLRELQNSVCPMCAASGDKGPLVGYAGL